MGTRSPGKGEPAIFDHEFIKAHTTGMDAYLAEVDATSWDKIVEQSGLSKAEIEQAATLYRQAERVIMCWAMGITQHRHSVPTVQEIANLQLLRGNVGKPGAGLSPVRGHSNVQGDRTMGIDEKAPAWLIDAVEKRFNFKAPRLPGHNTVQAIQAMEEGRAKVFIGLGGNFAQATPDTPRTHQALRNCDLTVHIATKLNRSHLVTGKDALILPCLGRTEIDMQAEGQQGITVEDTFSMVHISFGQLRPSSELLRSEPAIIAGIAKATLGNHPVDWDHLIADYSRIRDLIADVIPGFTNFNEKLKNPGGFHLGNSAAERNWNTDSGKAQFNANALPEELINAGVLARGDKPDLILQTMRSHDQYNTTLYGLDDRYRGVFGMREVVFINEAEIRRLGFALVTRLTWCPCGTTAVSAVSVALPWWHTTSRKVRRRLTTPRPTRWCLWRATATVPSRPPPSSLPSSWKRPRPITSSPAPPSTKAPGCKKATSLRWLFLWVFGAAHHGAGLYTLGALRCGT